MAEQKKIDITIVGGGMITHDLILPSVYQQQRMGQVGTINICALNNPPLKALAESPSIVDAFPGQSFNAFPALTDDPKKNCPELYKEVLAKMKPRSGVIVAMPDQFHYEVVKEALKNNLHVLCVKPLVLKYEQDVEIEKEAMEKGLFVGVEYHKRFDRRALIAKRDYELGNFGEFVIGEAKMIEPWLYRTSNFQNWFTADKTDPFVYVGCHYVDQVYFITGLKPTEVSVQGILGKFPNGNAGYMWANGRVKFENGALLNVTDGFGYPDDGAGSNDQCLQMFFEGDGQCGMLKHNDQFRGVVHSFLKGIGPGGTKYNFVNPDFYKLVPWEGKGYKPVGYGYESVAASVNSMYLIENAVVGLSEKDSLVRRREMIREIDEKGIIATPANSYINELVVEAARLSILEDGKSYKIVYGKKPHVEAR
jgi:predicted dehydrogenase